MKLVLYIFGFLIVFSSCKTQEARRPVSVKSGSFISESITRNKQLAAKEEGLIKKIMDNDTLNEYITSEGGFWYYYNKKDTISQKTPKFGDIVNFNYDLKDLNGNLIYSRRPN